jgi:hypothetical protein
MLMIFGILLAAGAGLCTTVVAVSDGGGPERRIDAATALVFGGPIILVGALLAWGGWALRRRKDAKTPSGPQ